jgi:hypothetical protein
MSCLYKDSLNTPLPICIRFISSSCLIALDRNSSTVLSRSGDYAHTCLIHEFRGTVFSFSPLSMMLTIDLSYITLYYVDIHSFCLQSHQSFYHETVFNLIEGVFLHLLR